MDPFKCDDLYKLCFGSPDEAKTVYSAIRPEDRPLAQSDYGPGFVVVDNRLKNLLCAAPDLYRRIHEINLLIGQVVGLMDISVVSTAEVRDRLNVVTDVLIDMQVGNQKYLQFAEYNVKKPLDFMPVGIDNPITR